MSRTEDLLNDLVYRIDDIVYDFYTESNTIIANKKNPERLIDFRDKAVATINDMNVRSLEIISGLKDLQLAEERINILVEKNRKIVRSSMEVIEQAPGRNDFVEEISNFANNIYEGAKETVQKIEKSDTYAKVKDQTKKGIDQTKTTIDNIINDPRVQEGVQVAKEKSLEVLDASAKFVKENTKKVSQWVEQRRQDLDEVESEIQEMQDDLREDLDDLNEPGLNLALDEEMIDELNKEEGVGE